MSRNRRRAARYPRQPAAAPFTPFDFAGAYKNILTEFGCAQAYLINPMLDADWRLSEADGLRLLNIDGRNYAVVLSKDQPLVYRKDGCALIVAIDCVKIAFLLDEKRELLNV